MSFGGEPQEVAACDDHPCYMDGSWMAWSAWSSCSATCEGGVATRTRSCDGPYGGGEPCEGAESREVTCNVDACPLSK